MKDGIILILKYSGELEVGYFDIDLACNEAFEEGADAILEALRKQVDSLYLLGVNVPTDPSYIKVTLRNDKGYWVFIPDNNSQLSHDKEGK